MASFFIHLGTLGIFFMGLCDGLLFAPFGLDLLLIVKAARHPNMVPLYVALAAAGSTVGYAFVDALARRGGEQGLKDKIGERKFDRLKNKITKHGGKAIALGAMMPPPFPFTVLFSAASAFQYPRVKLLSMLAGLRVARYILICMLARHYGRHLVRIFESTGFRAFVIGIVVVSVAGSAWTIYKWLRGSRGKAKQNLAPAA